MDWQTYDSNLSLLPARTWRGVLGQFVAPGTCVEAPEDPAAHQLFVSIFYPDLVQQSGDVARPHGLHIVAVRQITVPGQLDQSFFKLFHGHGLGGTYNQIA